MVRNFLTAGFKREIPKGACLPFPIPMPHLSENVTSEGNIVVVLTYDEADLLVPTIHRTLNATSGIVQGLLNIQSV